MNFKLPVRFLFITTLLLVAAASNATDYYVSATGNDSNNGTSQSTPWKTLGKVENVSNAGTIHAGDKILFKCGDSFTGTLSISSIWGHNAKSGTATNPITLGSYGSGAKPTFLYPAGGSTVAESRVLMYFVEIDYWIVDGLNFTDLNTTNNHVTPANLGIPLYLGSYGDGTCNHWIIRNVDISLCGMGVVIIGDYNTVTDCNMSNFKNLKSTPDTGGSSAWEDYGANPFTIIWSNNNTITHNYVSGGWSESLDFGYNGGFCETIGACSNNKITYNTIIDCNGLSEFGQGGNSADNLYAYNKLIDCGAMFWINGDCLVTNAQFFNNTVVETPNSRFAQGSPNAGAGVTSPEALSHLNVDAYMFDFSGSSQTASTVFNLKNNIIHVSNPLKIVKSTIGSKLAHDYNVVKLSGGSVAGFTMNTHDKSTAAVIFTNTTPANANAWDLNPPPASPPIDAGTNVGIAVDFIGNPVPVVPNAGILESSGSPSSLAATSTAGTIACNGGTATVTVTASGGTSPYSGTGLFTVTAGSYTYSVTDAAGIVRTTSITVTQPAVLTATLSAGTIAVFGGTTTLTVTAAGGTSGYTYKLNSGSYQSANVFNSVGAGSHSVIVKDANGCTVSQSISITEPAAPAQLVASSSAGTIICNGGTSIVLVSASGGVAPYTGTGQFTVSAGTYTYAVSDANGTTATTTVSVSQPSAIAVTVSAGTIAVFGGTTSVDVSASGGTGVYTYKLDGGNYQLSSTFSGVAAGSHSVTVKDANGCTSLKNFTLSQPAAPVQLVASSVASAIACNGGTAIVTVSATGGVAPYTGTGNFSVSAGTYTYTVTDANGSTAGTAVTVTQPAGLSLTLSAGTIAVFGGTTTLTANTTGGSGTYTYKINNSAYQVLNTFSNIAAGTYLVTVKDANGCTSVQTITITEPAQNTMVVTAVATPIMCNASISTITVSASGGIAPYTGTGYFTGYAGTYTYIVTDANGASASTTLIIAQPSAIVVTFSAPAITRTGGTTTVTINATGGSGSYSFSFNGCAFQASNIFANVVAGIYSLKVKDANGCIVTSTATLADPASGNFRINLVSKTNATCRGSRTGSLEVLASRGTAPYQYRLNDGRYTSNRIFSNLPTGIYRVSAKDANGNVVSLVTFILDGTSVCSNSGPSTGKINITAYPNPTADRFSLAIQGEPNAEVLVEVMNMNGRKVFERRGVINRNYVFGDGFMPGTYFVKVTQGNSSTTKVVIKTR